MSIATVITRALSGIEAVEVTVETHLSAGLPGFSIVGLPETAVKESKERVRSAIINSGLEFPARRITVNLAPADIPKAGGRYDLAIAASILCASGQLPESALLNMEILGELALNGQVRKVTGAISALVAAGRENRKAVLPAGNATEIALTNSQFAHAVSSLTDLVGWLVNPDREAVLQKYSPEDPAIELGHACPPKDLTTIDIRGQLAAKRAVQIAAAGQHNLLMLGPPGCGKTLLARTMVELLPPLTRSEALEVAAVRSANGEYPSAQTYLTRPIRSPHHSCTSVALVGGGSRISPGEASLAHRGVLFLDELTEFKPGALDGLREPLEAGEITISRANQRVVFPAAFQLLAAMNPCPCGHATNPNKSCRCSPDRVARYLGKLSGPFLDRMDMMVELASLSHTEILSQEQDATDWENVRATIACSRERQLQRQQKLNSQLTPAEVRLHCKFNKSLNKVLKTAIEQMQLSARSVHRLLKVARTIADYEGAAQVRRTDLLEALTYRQSRLQQSL